MPLLTKCSVFAAKIETTPGTPETLAAADGKYNAFNVEFAEDTEFNERPGQGGFSPLPGVPGPRSGTAKLETELSGTGGSGGGGGDWADVLLLGCGFAKSGSTYTPISCTTTPKHLTLGHYEDGRLRMIAGAQGTSTFQFRSGAPVRAMWEFTGAYVAPTTVAKIAPDYPGVISPRFVAATFTIGGTSFKVTTVDIALNNEVILRPDATSAAGFIGSVITGRRITVTVDPEALLYSTKDWNADWIASTQMALNIVLGASAGNTITITAPKLQLAGPPNPEDTDGIFRDKLVFQANRNTDAGDDELQIVLS